MAPDEILPSMEHSITLDVVFSGFVCDALYEANQWSIDEAWASLANQDNFIYELELLQGSLWFSFNAETEIECGLAFVFVDQALAEGLLNNTQMDVLIDLIIDGQRLVLEPTSGVVIGNAVDTAGSGSSGDQTSNSLDSLNVQNGLTAAGAGCRISDSHHQAMNWLFLLIAVFAGLLGRGAHGRFTK